MPYRVFFYLVLCPVRGARMNNPGLGGRLDQWQQQQQQQQQQQHQHHPQVPIPYGLRLLRTFVPFPRVTPCGSTNFLIYGTPLCLFSKTRSKKRRLFENKLKQKSARSEAFTVTSRRGRGNAQEPCYKVLTMKIHKLLEALIDVLLHRLVYTSTYRVE